MQELQFVLSPSQKSTPRDGNCLPESLFDQIQYVPELAGRADDPFELRVKVVLSVDEFLSSGLLIWPGNDETVEDEQYFGTSRQWKQKMMKSGTYGDAVFLQLASLHLETDIIVIPAFRESAENKTLGYSVVRAKNRTVSEPLFLFYFSHSRYNPSLSECMSSLR